MSKQNMTNSVLQLERRGLVSVQPNPEDGRSKLVKVTKKGKSFREKALAALQPLLAEIAQHEAFQSLDEALPAMQALRKFLDERRS